MNSASRSAGHGAEHERKEGGCISFGIAVLNRVKAAEKLFLYKAEINKLYDVMFIIRGYNDFG